MKLIIFDIDGTLVYSDKKDSQCFADTYQEVYQVPFPTIDWSTYPHVVDTVIFKHVIHYHFNRIPDQKEMDDFQSLFAQKIQEKRYQRPTDFLEVPGAKQMVDHLLNHPNFVVGIGTGGWLQPAKIKLNHVGIPEQELILSAADRQASREGILQYAIDQAQQVYEQFEQIVYIGDALWDVRTTRNMQLDFIGIRRRNDTSFLENAGATQVFANYLQPSQFLKAIGQAQPPI